MKRAAVLRRDRRHRTSEQIRSKIAAPHMGMPEIAQVLGLNLDDLVAYIVSLDEE
jgi:hypothetical protein